MTLADARRYLSLACSMPTVPLQPAVAGVEARLSLAGRILPAGAGDTCGETGSGHSSQILKEIDYAIRFHQVRPVVYLAYERIAFSGKEDPELRITFDMNIRARDYGLELDQGTFGTPLLGKREFLMEVKIPGAMPLWMSQTLSELEIYPVSYSKYGTWYQEFLAGKELEEGGKICA